MAAVLQTKIIDSLQIPIGKNDTALRCYPVERTLELCSSNRNQVLHNYFFRAESILYTAMVQVLILFSVLEKVLKFLLT